MWKFTVVTPDGRTFGPYSSEHEAKAKRDAFNASIPRGGKLATIKTEPTYAAR